MADRAEDVVQAERYRSFDEFIDRYQKGECTYEEAVADYQRHIGATAVAGSAD